MAELAHTTTHPDVDLLTDVTDVFYEYPPLQHDRSRITVNVTDGVVTLSGHVKTSGTHEFLLRAVAQVAGVRAVHSETLYHDDALRIQVAQYIPYGVFLTVAYGALILNGKLPAGVNVVDLVAQLEKIAGVRQVILNFKP
ncbi:MAG: BON domain-containing protein [Phototrophicaceae bacterium]|jgi:hypothetical protein